MNRLFNSYFRYTPFADDSSHHGEKLATPHIKYICVGRKESCNVTDNFVIVASFSYNGYHKLNAADVKNVLKDVVTTTDSLYTFESGMLSWNVLMDDINLIYIMICTTEYPRRCADLCLHELQSVFRATAGRKSLTCKDEGLSGYCKSHMSKICEKYDEIEQVDALARTNNKVENLKLAMQQNIEISLQNTVKMEDVQNRANDLSMQANVFKKKGKQLKNNLKWQNIKTRVYLGLFVLLVVGSIAGIVYFVFMRSKETSP
mmetsp:Transcript_18270/g.30466  ORF Transcript_18270/g.30466 Transcript_18270/m.30466 type:complete len:260 (-) Transcript_18270:300-1079(-)